MINSNNICNALANEFFSQLDTTQKHYTDYNNEKNKWDVVEQSINLLGFRTTEPIGLVINQRLQQKRDQISLKFSKIQPIQNDLNAQRQIIANCPQYCDQFIEPILNKMTESIRKLNSNPQFKKMIVDKKVESLPKTNQDTINLLTSQQLLNSFIKKPSDTDILAQHEFLLNEYKAQCDQNTDHFNL